MLPALFPLPTRLISQLALAGVVQPYEWLAERLGTVETVRQLPGGWWIIPLRDKGRWSNQGIGVRFTQEGLVVPEVLWRTDGEKVPTADLLTALESANSALPGTRMAQLEPQAGIDLTALTGVRPEEAGDWLGVMIRNGSLAVATAPDRLLVMDRQRGILVRLLPGRYAVSLHTHRFVKSRELTRQLSGLTGHAVKRISARWQVPPGEAESFLIDCLRDEERMRCLHFGWFLYAVVLGQLIAVLAPVKSGWRCVTAYPPFVVGLSEWNNALTMMTLGRFGGFVVARDPAEGGLIGDASQQIS